MPPRKQAKPQTTLLGTAQLKRLVAPLAALTLALLPAGVASARPLGHGPVLHESQASKRASGSIGESSSTPPGMAERSTHLARLGDSAPPGRAIPLKVGASSLEVASGSSGIAVGQPGSSRLPAASPSSPDRLSGFLSAPGGPFIRDRYGRVVILHGVNAVYKLAPYELVVGAKGKPYDFTASQAKLMASLGFDVVRLGVLWEGLEPGTLGANSPSICTEGVPGHAHQYSQRALDAYLAKVHQVVNLLGHYGIYSLIDMHQDVYSQLFAGEGAPAWAVCTNGLPPTDTGNWEANYAEPAVGVAYDHFWDNDVVGNLQGNYDRVYGEVARSFRSNPWVVGYDLFNEPFSTEVFTAAGSMEFDNRLECFYTGKAHPGELSIGHLPTICPPDDPAEGLIDHILSADPSHLIFYEPDVTDDFGNVDDIGPMPFSNLVLDFHDYCLAGSLFTQLASSCPAEERLTLTQQSAARSRDASPTEPSGPAWFMSEFGSMSSNSTASQTDLIRMTAYADDNLLGWSYWAWKYYDDPTGGAGEGLVSSTGNLKMARAMVLSQPYAQAIAGTPVSMSYDISTDTFHLTYVPDHSIWAPTIVFVPRLHYPHGYCVHVSGANVTSEAGNSHLILSNLPQAATVELTVAPGSCDG